MATQQVCIGSTHTHTHAQNLDGPCTFRLIRIHTLFEGSHVNTFPDICRSVFTDNRRAFKMQMFFSPHASSKSVHPHCSHIFLCADDLFILSNVCFAFGLLLLPDQCQSSSPFLTGRPHSCEKSNVSEAALGPELRTRFGAASRRGSAPVIDTRSANHIAQLHALIQSLGSIRPAAPDSRPDLDPTELHSEGGFPFRSSLPALQGVPVSPPSDCRRCSDAAVGPPFAAAEISPPPVPSGRRHSDLSSLLSRTAHHSRHFGTYGGQVCHACLSLLLLRAREGSHRRPLVAAPTRHSPRDLRTNPSSAGATATPGYGRLKGLSDCSDFSLLQRSLFNIIGRKAPPPGPAQAPLLPASAAHRPARSDGDAGLKSHLPRGGLVEDREPEDRLCARERQVPRAVGGVGHIRRVASA